MAFDPMHVTFNGNDGHRFILEKILFLQTESVEKWIQYSQIFGEHQMLLSSGEFVWADITHHVTLPTPPHPPPPKKKKKNGKEMVTVYPFSIESVCRMKKKCLRKIYSKGLPY